MVDSVVQHDASLNDYNILNPADAPAKAVTSIVWAPTQDFNVFACTDMDSKIRIYNILPTGKAILQNVCFSADEPCLCTAWKEDMSKLYAGSLDNSVLEFDVKTGKSQNIGRHETAVRDIYYLSSLNLFCSLSSEGIVKFWDARQSKSVESYNLGYQVHCSDMMFLSLAIGLSQAKIQLFDLSKFREEMINIKNLESPLGTKSLLTSISISSDGKTLGVAAQDGRGNLSKIEEDQNGKFKLSNILTWKAQVSQDRQIVYPVHGIGFNPRSKSLVYTAGEDGVINYWDWVRKDRITMHKFQNIPVTKIKTSPSGDFLAYALENPSAQNTEESKSMGARICVHTITADELEYVKK